MHRHHERPRPLTVTRGLPHYVIGKDYRRLLRLTRYVDHSIPAYYSRASREMIFEQYQRLFRKVYG